MTVTAKVSPSAVAQAVDPDHATYTGNAILTLAGDVAVLIITAVSGAGAASVQRT